MQPGQIPASVKVLLNRIITPIKIDVSYQDVRTTSTVFAYLAKDLNDRIKILRDQIPDDILNEVQIAEKRRLVLEIGKQITWIVTNNNSDLGFRPIINKLSAISKLYQEMIKFAWELKERVPFTRASSAEVELLLPILNIRAINPTLINSYDTTDVGIDYRVISAMQPIDAKIGTIRNIVIKNLETPIIRQMERAEGIHVKNLRIKNLSNMDLKTSATVDLSQSNFSLSASAAATIGSESAVKVSSADNVIIDTVQRATIDRIKNVGGAVSYETDLTNPTYMVDDDIVVGATTINTIEQLTAESAANARLDIYGVAPTQATENVEVETVRNVKISQNRLFSYIQTVLNRYPTAQNLLPTIDYIRSFLGLREIPMPEINANNKFAEKVEEEEKLYDQDFAKIKPSLDIPETFWAVRKSNSFSTALALFEPFNPTELEFYYCGDVIRYMIYCRRNGTVTKSYLELLLARYLMEQENFMAQDTEALIAVPDMALISGQGQVRRYPQLNISTRTPRYSWIRTVFLFMHYPDELVTIILDPNTMFELITQMNLYAKVISLQNIFDENEDGDEIAGNVLPLYNLIMETLTPPQKRFMLAIQNSSALVNTMEILNYIS